MQFKNPAWLAALCFTGALCAAGTAEAATFYASPTGSKTGAGTQADPWDITKACTASVLKSGDVVRMRGGVYPTANNFSINGYGFVLAPRRAGVTYKSYPGEWAIIRGGTTASAQMNTIGLDANNLTFDSLEIRWGGRFGIGWFGRRTGVVIRNCVFDSTPHPNADIGDNAGCISTNTADGYMDGWLIEDNVFRHINARGAVHSYGMDRTIVRGNRFYGISNGWGAIFLKTGYYTNRDNLWENNIVEATGAGMGIGVHCNGDVKNLVIRNNIVYGTAYSLIQLSYAECFQAPIDYDSIYVYNNTIDASSLSSGQAAIRNEHGNKAPVEDMDNFWIFNNLIYRAPSGMAVRIENYANDGSYAAFGNNWYSDYNAFIPRAAGNAVYAWRQSGGSYANYTLPQWQSAASTLNATYTGDPHSFANTDTTLLFINRAARNYALNPLGPLYTLLSSTGRGAGYPTYIGAQAAGPSTPDTTDPVISAVLDSGMTGCAGYVSWQTNELANSEVDYGVTTGLELGTVTSQSFVQSHVVLVPGLQPSQTYYYRVRSSDPWGNTSQSGLQTMTTTNSGCNSAQGILATVSASYAGYDPVRITDGQIDPYGAEATTWASDDGATGADWVTVDFLSPISVANVTVHWAWNAFASAWTTSQQFEIQSWNGSTYNTIATVNSATGQSVSSTNFAPVSTSRIRLRQPAGQGPASYPGILWLTEMQVYGSPDADSIPPAAVTDLR